MLLFRKVSFHKMNGYVVARNDGRLQWSLALNFSVITTDWESNVIIDQAKLSIPDGGLFSKGLELLEESTALAELGEKGTEVRLCWGNSCLELK